MEGRSRVRALERRSKVLPWRALRLAEPACNPLMWRMLLVEALNSDVPQDSGSTACAAFAARLKANRQIAAHGALPSADAERRWTEGIHIWWLAVRHLPRRALEASAAACAGAVAGHAS